LLSPGDKLKDYEVIAPLTSGGMATLVLARRRGVGGFSRLVALKLVHPHLAEDHAMINMFLDEARISAHVVHPNVVHVEEVGVEDGIYFIAMEYVHGASMAHLLKRLSQDRRRVSPTLAVCLIAQVAEALHAAHEAVGENGKPLHIVHRDVSPQNILIAHTGHVKLIDFGIAKSQAALHQSRTGQGVLGKLRYMSPEQLYMGSVDRRTDVYALGVVLWEMLTAKNLFRCARLDDPRDQSARENPPAPSRHASLVKSALDRVVQKALAPNPNDRYATTLELRSALLRAQPEAGRVDAPKLAAMLHAVVGNELDEQRAALPHEVTRALALADTMPQTVQEQETLCELTQHIPGGELDSQEIPAADRTEVSPLAMHEPTLPAPSMSPASAKEILGETQGVSYSWLVASCVACTVVGLWIGRVTSIPIPARTNNAAIVERVVTGAAFRPEPKVEPFVATAPLTPTAQITGTVEVGAIEAVKTTIDAGTATAHESIVKTDSADNLGEADAKSAAAAEAEHSAPHVARPRAPAARKVVQPATAKKRFTKPVKRPTTVARKQQ
jgi:serine/threonine-protein kinase